MQIQPAHPQTNYNAWQALPMLFSSGMNAMQQSKAAAEKAKMDQLELAMKMKKLQGGGGDFSLPNYEAKLRDELWGKAGGLERMQKSISSFNALRSAVAAKSDVAILYNFIKALDPDSVVREGEVALARLGIPILDDAARKLTNAIKTNSTADILNDALRNQMVNFATSEIVNGAKAYSDKERKMKGVIADYAPWGVMESRVIPGGSYLPQGMFDLDEGGGVSGLSQSYRPQVSFEAEPDEVRQARKFLADRKRQPAQQPAPQQAQPNGSYSQQMGL